MRILLIEDDKTIRNELSEFLTKYQYEVIAPDEFSVDVILNSRAQLVLLDINLPAYDGFYLCREVRKQSDIPIIIVTSRDSDADELMSMHLGADDFITKPYNTQILLARITSVLKRAYPSDVPHELTRGELTLDLARGIAGAGGREVELSKNESRILHLLMKRQPAVLSREELMNELWQSDEFVDDNTLTVNINRLRKKLEDIGLTDFIITKRGQGYHI